MNVTSAASRLSHMYRNRFKINRNYFSGQAISQQVNKRSTLDLIIRNAAECFRTMQYRLPNPSSALTQSPITK